MKSGDNVHPCLTPDVLGNKTPIFRRAKLCRNNQYKQYALITSSKSRWNVSSMPKICRRWWMNIITFVDVIVSDTSWMATSEARIRWSRWDEEPVLRIPHRQHHRQTEVQMLAQRCSGRRRRRQRCQHERGLKVDGAQARRSCCRPMFGGCSPTNGSYTGNLWMYEVCGHRNGIWSNTICATTT